MKTQVGFLYEGIKLFGAGVSCACGPSKTSHIFFENRGFDKSENPLKGILLNGGFLLARSFFRLEGDFL